jgi:arsenite-transporting ATPase
VRLVLVMGKGGVGKTTLSAATALLAAHGRAKVLVVSTDAAHSLADVLDVRLGEDPTPVTSRLDALQLDGRHELQQAWSAIAGYLRDLLGVAELDRIQVEELLVIPGLEELLALSRLRSLMESGRWDAVIVDCAPSADSLRLFSLPEVLDWYGARIFGRDGTMRARVRRAIERTLSVAAPDETVVASTTELSAGLADLRRVLNEADTSVRVVITPERLVVAEAQRTLSYLALYGYAVDAVLVNRVLDGAAASPWLETWKASQTGQLARIEELFGPLPRLVAPLLPAEPVGSHDLLDVGRQVYGGLDPLARLSDGQALEITTDARGTRVRVPVAGLDREAIRLHRDGPELVVTLGAYRRTVALPDALSRHEVVRAGVIDGALEVDFAEVGIGVR